MNKNGLKFTGVDSVGGLIQFQVNLQIYLCSNNSAKKCEGDGYGV